jgi:fucose permease
MTTKASILVFYLGLSENNKIFRRLSQATLLLVLIPGTALTILNIAQCRPVAAVFDTVVPPGAKCTDVLTLFLSSAPVNIITDLAILFLPMPVLTGMRLPRKQKQVLVFVFALGGFVAIVDVVRIAYLQQASFSRLETVQSGSGGSGRDAEEADFSWYAALSYMWSAVEVHVGIICACIPTIKPLVVRLLPKLLRDDTKTTQKSQSRQASDFMPVDFGRTQERQVSFRNSGLGILPSPEPESPQSQVGRSRPNEPGDDNIVSHDQGDARFEAYGQYSERDFGPRAQESEPAGPHDMTMLDFITAPDPDDTQRHRRNSARTPQLQQREASAEFKENRASRISRFSRLSRLSRASRGSHHPEPTFFDFVTMHGPKSVIKLSNRESVRPFVLVTVLFFLWGFAYGFLSILNSQFQVVVGVSDWESVGLHAAYFGGYLIGPLTYGYQVLHRLGYKATFIVGLCVYSCGTLIFWPSAVLTSVPAFFVCNFIVGLGVSTLEIAANPFIAICGPPEYAEVRLNISQGVQAIGSVLAPLLAKKVLFKNVYDAPSLVDVQWTYLAIALFDVLLAVGFYYTHLPEATDEELEELASKNPAYKKTVFGYEIVLVTLAFGVWSQFFYVGGQEAVAGLFEPYAQYVLPSTSAGKAFDYHIVGYTVFAAGRFLGAGAFFVFAPRVILLVSYLGCVITAGLLMVTKSEAGIAMIILATLFEVSFLVIFFSLPLLTLNPLLGSDLAHHLFHHPSRIRILHKTWLSTHHGRSLGWCLSPTCTKSSSRQNKRSIRKLHLGYGLCIRYAVSAMAQFLPTSETTSRDQIPR